MTDAMKVAALKATARRQYLARRAARPDFDRNQAERQLFERARQCDLTVIAAFVPVAGEPGSLAVLDELSRHARVLLPITRSIGQALEWAVYDGPESLTRGPMGLRQPARPDGSRLEDAQVVLAPALAIGRDGTRLGHGGGFYDRALAGMPLDRLCGVVYDDEVADTLPTEDHDVRVGWVCTPTATTRLLR